MSETELGREPVELLELIVPKCANVYGSAPCAASGSGDAKCFNTRATCQDLDNFQETPLEHLGTADIVAEQGDTGSHTLNGADPYLLQIDLRIPNDPSGVLFEIGGSGRGVYVGFTAGNLVARCGEGSGAPTASTSNIEIDPSNIEGKQGTLIYEFGRDGSGFPEGTLYFFDPLELELTQLGADTASASTANFGVDNYGVGTVSAGNAGNVTEDQTDYNGIITGVRLHANTSATLTPDADAYRLKYYFDDGRKAKPSDDVYILGYLLNLSSVSSRINISAADPRYEPIGRRATVSAALSDHPHTDFPFDPYLSDRTYDPLERSTFWSKFIKRHKFGKTRALARRYTGYSGQALSSMQTQTFFLDALNFDGTTSAQIQMRDYLSLTEFSKAQVPAPSAGKLDAAIDASQTTMSLTGDVLDEYPATGTVRIDEEVLTYTGRTYDGSGDKTDFAGLTRGTDGSTADEHDIEEGVQLCRRYVQQRVDTILDELLIDDASIPQQLVDSATFTATYDENLSAYTLTTLITEPTSVSKLIGEISLQCSFYLWWDSRDQVITCQAIKPLSGTDAQLTQENNIVAGGFRVLEKPKERITTIAFYYNPRDWAKDIEKPVNYKNQLIVSNSEAGYESLTETREILSRWLTTEAQANQTSSRISVRYQDVPQYIELIVDAKDRSLWLGSFVTVSHDAIVDAYGERDESRRWLVIEADEVEAGHKQKITLVDVTLDGILVNITENGIGTYTAALFGAGNAFITDASGLNPDGTTGARIG